MAKNSGVMTATRRRQRVNPDAARNWWRETRAELRKVTWPTAEQTRNLTLVVVAVCAVMAVFLGIADAVFNWLVQLVTGV